MSARRHACGAFAVSSPNVNSLIFSIQTLKFFNIRYKICPHLCTTTKSNIAVIQRYQSKLLRSMTNVPWYVSNHTLHFDLHIPYVYMVFRERTATHRSTLDSHPNSLMEPLVHPPINRRLKRR